jgi:hypothetical protein
MRYFCAHNISRYIAGVLFEPAGAIGGTLTGIYATDDPVLGATLGELAKNPASAVWEIEEEEYAKKKPRAQGTASFPPSPPQSITGTGAQVVEGGQSPPPVEQAPVLSVADATKVEPVKTGRGRKKST